MPEFIHMEHYARRDHFRHFCSLSNPFVSVTVNVDVSDLVKACKTSGISFYLAMIHGVANAANTLPPFRQRIRGENIVQYESCITSHIELLDDDTYCYCNLRHDLPLEDYLTTAAAARQPARSMATIEEDPADSECMYFVSCLPWLHYTSLSEPTGSDSNPRFSWGRYEADHLGRLMMPLTVTVHHGLADGLHIARFYQHLEGEIQSLATGLIALEKR